jgi:hypothetical protein
VSLKAGSERKLRLLVASDGKVTEIAGRLARRTFAQVIHIGPARGFCARFASRQEGKTRFGENKNIFARGHRQKIFKHVF